MESAQPKGTFQYVKHQPAKSWIGLKNDTSCGNDPNKTNYETHNKIFNA